MSENLLLALVTGLVVIGGVYVVHEHLPLSLGRATSFEPAQKSGHFKPTTRKSHAMRAGARGSRKSHAPSPGSTPEETAGLPIFAIEIRPPRPPRASDIRANMSLQDLTRRFGKPNLEASWSDAGRLNQILIYENGGKALVVKLQDGRVVSSRE